MNNPATNTNPLLTTKLRCPPPRPHLVPRPHLIERLCASDQYQLTLISAPAGFGKTTLLSTWLHEDSYSHHATSPVAWVSLDTSDNDVTRFWSYIITALDSIHASIGASTLSILHAPQPPPIEDVLTSLLNVLTTHPQPAMLVLDDYHVITDQSVHESLTFLLDHLSPNLHLILASRTEPPLPLARLRVRGQLNELRTIDLRFNTEETRLFLQQISHLDLPADTIQALEARTEGWIAGLQLAALSLRNSPDISHFLANFTGSHRYIADYLFAEVLQQQPEHIQSFLLQTSILDRLTATLCDALTGRNDSQATLTSLEQANLFIVPLDEQRHWYRYHQLFSDFLRNHLQHTSSTLIPTLYRNASDWYWHNALPTEAIDCALAAQDHAQAALLIEQIAHPLLQRRELTTFLRWVEALPVATLHSRPQLYMAYATTLATTGQMQAASRCLEDIAELLRTLHENLSVSSLSPKQLGDLALEVATMQQLLAPTEDKQQPNGHSLPGNQQSTERSSEDDPELRSLAAFSEGMTKGLSGDMEGAKQALREASALALSANNTYLALTTSCQLGTIQWSQARLHEAYQTFLRALQMGQQSSHQLLDLGLAHIGISSVLIDWNELDAAAQHIRLSLEQSQQSGNVAITLFSCTALAQIQQALGNIEAVPPLLQEAEDIVRKHEFPLLILASIKGNLALLALANDNLDQAEAWLEEYVLTINDSLQPAYIAAYLALARLFIARQKYDEASSLLSRLQQLAEEQQLPGNLIRILVTQALLLHAQSNLSQALPILARALSLGEPEGFVRVFIEDGAPMAALLTRLYKARLKHHKTFSYTFSLVYVSKLLLAFPSNNTTNAQLAEVRKQQRPLQPLVDPLSERELEVLRLIALGKSNAEIAQYLVVEMSTLKTHIHHLYRKLNVHSRTQAIVRGKQLQLIST